MLDLVIFWRLRKQSPWSQADSVFSLLNKKVDRTGLVCKINSRPTDLPTAVICCHTTACRKKNKILDEKSGERHKEHRILTLLIGTKVSRNWRSGTGKLRRGWFGFS